MRISSGRHRYRNATALGVFAAVGLLAGAAIPANAATAASELTDSQLAGQRVIYSYAGPTPPGSLLQHIRNGEAAGVIFFGENITSKQQISGVVDELKQANAQSPVHAPLLLLTDQEGGQVNRLPGAPKLSEKQVGQATDPVAAATKAGTGAGDNLASVGMNLNLSPVLGVYRKEGDFLDRYGRSYGMDPGQVAKLGKAFISAQQGEGVSATAKHFPGLGAAAADENTDERPVTLDLPLSQLRSVDEAPYQAAIAAKVPVIMASWAVYPALDANRPAGLSGTVIRHELRGRLGFDGVTMTDALEAGALKQYGTPDHRGLLAAQAGMDLLLCSARDVSQGEKATTGLANALEDGTLDRSDFTAAVDRVTALRNSLK